MHKYTLRYRRRNQVKQSSCRAKRVGVADTLTLDEWNEILRISKGICKYCGSVVGEDALTIEHVMPLEQGGTNTKENVAAVCKKCNDKKGDHLPDGQKPRRSVIEVYRDYTITESGIMFKIYLPYPAGCKFCNCYYPLQKTVEDARTTIDNLIGQGGTKVPIDNLTTL